MDDPRRFPDAAEAPAAQARLHEIAAASLSAATAQAADAHDAALCAALDALLRPGQGAGLAALFASAPTAAIYRHLWRALVMRERAGAPDPDSPMRLFAVPVIVVAGVAQTGEASVTLPALVDSAALVALLREHRVLAGHETMTLASALTSADTLELARLPELLAWRTLEDAPRTVAPAPIVVTAGPERVHLRFLVGTVVAAPAADPLRDREVARWGIPFAQALVRDLSAPGISVLALPRAPQPLVTALWQGRQAQREVGAQLFASNAIRKLRAATGEPTAVISIHRTDAPGGEVRLSLSSPFDPREAEGFRCPLYPLDRVDDVVQMLSDLLADCRANDVRVLPGVHADRDVTTGATLLFKAEGPAIPTAH